MTPGGLSRGDHDELARPVARRVTSCERCRVVYVASWRFEACRRRRSASGVFFSTILAGRDAHEPALHRWRRLPSMQWRAATVRLLSSSSSSNVVHSSSIYAHPRCRRFIESAICRRRTSPVFQAAGARRTKPGHQPSTLSPPRLSTYSQTA